MPNKSLLGKKEEDFSDPTALGFCILYLYVCAISLSRYEHRFGGCIQKYVFTLLQTLLPCFYRQEMRESFELECKPYSLRQSVCQARLSKYP